MMEEAITYIPWIFTFLSLPMFFALVISKDLVMLKIGTMLKKKKGVKLVIDITKDKNVSFKAECIKDGKMQRAGQKEGVEWKQERAYFSRDLGVQACFTLEGTQAIFDPIGGQKIDLADGEVVDRMVKRAELMRDINQGWLETREQKLLVLILIVGIACAGLSFMSLSSLGQLMEMIPAQLNSMAAMVNSIPRTL